MEWSTHRWIVEVSTDSRSMSIVAAAEIKTTDNKTRLVKVSTGYRAVEVSTNHKTMEVSTDHRAVEVSTNHRAMEVSIDHRAVEVSVDHRVMEISTDNRPVEGSTNHKSTKVSPNQKYKIMKEVPIPFSLPWKTVYLDSLTRILVLMLVILENLLGIMEVFMEVM